MSFPQSRPQSASPFLTVLLLLAFVTSGVAAASTNASGEDVSPAAASSDSDLRTEIEQLRQLVAAQQKRLEKLEKNETQPAVTSTPNQPISSPAQTADTRQSQSSSVQPSSADAQLSSGSTDERVRNLERQIKGLGPISLSGDLRLRGEPILGGPKDQSLDRTRARFRARLNFNADLGEQFKAGLTLASGDVNDPISTNQTLGGFYTRKAIALDQAFLTYTPSAFKPLTLTGGKFRYPWVNTELTWDKDLNPEGFAQKLDFNFNSSPVLKGISLVGFELPFAEVARAEATNKSIVQSVMYGGQLQTRWRFGPRVKFSAYSAFYDFHGTDAIALALARASSKNPQTPLSGAVPLQAGGNVVQNSIVTTTSTNVVTVNGTNYPTGVTTITNAQFASKFGLFDNIARFDIDTGNVRLPLTFIGDFVQNIEACANLSHILGAPGDSASLTYKQTTSAPCNRAERRGYWLEARVGRLQKKGDWQSGYTRIFIDREAVLGNFNYSDIRQGTNVTEHRFDVFYQVQNSVQLGFTALIGRPIGISSTTGTIEPWVTRLQFDTVYIF
jgi:hypothetical protein